MTLRVEDLASEFFEALRGLIAVAGELASKHIYLDPADPRESDGARAFCGLCLRYGLNFREVEHAPSCLVGRALAAVAAVREFLPASPIEKSATSSAAIAEPKSVSAEERSCALEPEGEFKERGVEYLADPFSRAKNFNPYTHPCPGIRGSVVCEMEEGHSGDCSRDGVTWTNSTRRFA